MREPHVCTLSTAFGTPANFAGDGVRDGRGVHAGDGVFVNAAASLSSCVAAAGRELPAEVPSLSLRPPRRTFSRAICHEGPSDGAQ